MTLWIVTAILLTLSLIVTGWFYNRARGSGKYPKVAVYAVWFLTYLSSQFAVDWHGMLASATFASLSVPYAQEWMLHLPAFFLLWACFSFGWGKFFPTGWNKTPDGKVLWQEKEFPPAEWLANLIVGKWEKDMDPNWVKDWQMIGMSGRFGFTFGAFLMPYLAAVNESLLTLLVAVPGSFLVGVMYRLGFATFDSGSVKRSENYTGALLGLLFALPLFTKIFKKKTKGEE